MHYVNDMVRLWAGTFILLWIGSASTGPIGSTDQTLHVPREYNSTEVSGSGPNKTHNANVTIPPRRTSKTTGMDVGPVKPMDMGMQMYFHISNNEVVLFKGWHTQSWAGMFLSCLFFIIMAVIMEGLRVFRHSMKVKINVPPELLPTNAKSGDSETASNTLLLQAPGLCMREALKNKNHILQSLLHIFHVALAFFLMLAAMTFNLWIFVSLCLGAGLGHYLFAWRSAEIDTMEGICH